MSWCTSCQSAIHGCKILILIIVFLDLFTDSLLLTLVDPILPDILARAENSSVKIVEENAKLHISDVINTHGRYGFLIAAKGGTQFICNPLVGYIVNKVGYRIPMLIGNIISVASTIAFAYGPNYWFLFVTRMLQGASSSVTAVAGMGLLAATYTENVERGKIMGVAICGLSLGLILGPVYGSVLYDLVNRQMPFLLVAGMVGLCIVLQSLTLPADKKHTNRRHSEFGIFKLLLDPYILIVAANVFVMNLDIAIVLAFLPMHLIDLENPPVWKLGIVVLPTSIGYLLSSLVCPRITRYVPRWLCSLVGFVLSGMAMLGLEYCTGFTHMLVDTTFLGLGLGMISTAMQPLFALIVDLRHETVYGNAYAISDMAVCLAMFLGPLVGGPVYYKFGFIWLVVSVGLLNIGLSLLSMLLRNLPAEQYYEVMFSDGHKEPTDESKPLLDSKLSAASLSSFRTTLPTVRRKSLLRSKCVGSREPLNLPTPRYVACLSGAEDLCSDTDSIEGCYNCLTT